jgi:hypothetical protein
MVRRRCHEALLTKAQLARPLSWPPSRAGPHDNWDGSRQLRRPFHNTPPVAR